MTRSAAARPVAVTPIHWPEALALTLVAALPAFLNLSAALAAEEEKSSLVRIAALAALPALVATWTVVDQRIRRHPVVIAIGLFTIWLLITSLAGIAPGVSLLGAHLRRHGAATAVALSVVFLAMLPGAGTASGRARLVAASIAGSFWPAIVLLLERAGVNGIGWLAPASGFVKGGTFGNTVLAGGYLALMIPLTAMAAWSWRRRWLAAIVCLQLAALATTASRGAALAALAAGAVFAIVVAADRIGKRTVALAVAVATALAILVFSVDALRPAWVTQALDPSAGTPRVRILIWDGVVRLMRADRGRLWIGYGPDSLARVFPAVYPSELGRVEGGEAMPDRAHNETLDTLVSAGVIGVVLQLALFATVLGSALRARDPVVRAGLAAAAVAHIVEIHFGIATSVSRLAFFSVAAVAVGSSTDDEGARVEIAWRPIAVAAGVGALSPAISLVPYWVVDSPGAGTAANLVAYLTRLSLATPILYGVLLATAVVFMRSKRHHRAPSTTWAVRAGVAAGLAAAVPLAITPSRAETFSRAGASFEAQQQWTEAAIAYGEASRLMPSDPEYLDNQSRAIVMAALALPPPQRSARLIDARDALAQARAIDPRDPNLARHLGGVYRIRGLALDGASRDEALAEASRQYAEAIALSPGLTRLVLESAFIDVDRNHIADARAKLARVLAIDPWRMGPEIDALKSATGK